MMLRLEQKERTKYDTKLKSKIVKKKINESDKTMTYISLFNGAGIGCHGFKMNGFECIASNEILEKRLNIQKYNNKCRYQSGYILGDLSNSDIKNKIHNQIRLWRTIHSIDDVDVVIATPPCQGMSVANHGKNNEVQRNSLIIHALSLIKTINPKIVIFENVRTFLNTPCVDLDNKTKSIGDAIRQHLSNYNIHCDVINFKDYGNPSQRTRTIVIGTRKDIEDVSPYDLFPTRQKEKTLRTTIGNMSALTRMGEIDKNDIYHFFREYDRRMIDWICDLNEGQSAFENNDISKVPHTIKNGKIILNKNKNGDKYKRCYWDKPMYCIHTRNDILASQMTIHPKDNRVFSIRELMKLMSIPDNFRWSEKTFGELNKMSLDKKKQFLKKEELNIRSCIGEAVPTIIFQKIARSIKKLINTEILTDADIRRIIKFNKLEVYNNLSVFVSNNLRRYRYAELSRIIEMSNSKKDQHSAYYTSGAACFSLVESLPKFNENKHVRILEPSVGMGNFLPFLIKKYEHCASVEIDVIDIDPDAINLLKLLIKKISIPNNVIIRYIHNDFLTSNIQKQYDIVIGNPPFKQITKNKELLHLYKQGKYNGNTNNIFAYFIEDAIKYGNYISLIVPKSLLSTPEFNKTRELINNYNIVQITDFGEHAFDIKIETVGITLKKSKRKSDNRVCIESYITKESRIIDQSYMTFDSPSCWLIYRDRLFDRTKKKMKFGIFTVFRDRQITNKLLKTSGVCRVLKSRNIDCNKIVDIKNYDRYIDQKQLDVLAVRKYMNEKAVLIPNLTYLPRACFLPRNTICDGSVAIAKIKDGERVNKKTLTYYSTDEFRSFYRIARNNSTRSMNIDSNSICFFGKLIQ